MSSSSESSDPHQMASAPFKFFSTPQVVLFILLLCLAFMAPLISRTVTASTSNTTGHCIKAEREALLTFKAQLIYSKAHPISTWGDQTDDCCQWAGVRCDNNSGHVIHLINPPLPYYYDYEEPVLSGNISKSLTELQHLRYLDLSSSCFFNNPIPKWLGSLENLFHLDLSFNCFTGGIPHELGNLTKLRYLNLAAKNRSLKVDDAEWLSGLSSLRHLYMDDVGFFGVNNVMQSFNKLPHLKEVSLFACGMSSIPESLPYLNFSSLTFMDIGANIMFNNTRLPEWLFRIPNLRFLNMMDCLFTGILPSSVGNATSLQYLDLSYNRGISGDMPRGFGDLCNLMSLWLDGTFLGKSLEDFGDAFSGCIRRNLNELSFGESSLQGPLPDWLGEFRNLTFLYLSDNSLHGSIPASIGRLSRLQHLYLSYNALNGSIPESLGRLSGLEYLNLEENALSGSIPESLGRLSGLQYLKLAENALNGSIPESLGRLSGLQNLNLEENALSGSIPESLGRLSGLQYLNLEQNALSGSIPESLGRISGMQFLYLAQNELNGTIPESLFQLSNVVYFDLSNNNFNYSSVITEAHLANLTSLKYLSLGQLVLNISTDWSPGFQAEFIKLSSCDVGPKFPIWLANQVNYLRGLDLSNTGIRDSIPDWFWNITPTIYFLDLSNNEISGRLPQRLNLGTRNGVGIFLGSNRFEGSVPSFSPNVFALDLSNNSLSGVIPSDLGNFGGIQPQLESPSLSSNNLTGSIPNSLCNLVILVLLDLSNNHLKGAIPNCWNNLTRLNYLILANNSLTGEVPYTLMSCSQSLQVLHLSNNQLQGEFPSFLKKCTSMTTLALDHNNLSGEIPSWVGETMTSLMILTLKKNNFSGNLPLLSNLTSLHFLDLSHNSFEGSIPQSYGNLNGMINGSLNGGARFQVFKYLIIKITVSTKGMVDLQYGAILSSFIFIDLSANNLSGQIPKEIVKLVGLQNLDLSCNHLSGEIPSDIGLMQSLESLDLSRNELIGSIPPGLSTLHFLESLNLSHNNLSGKIPYTSQLTTFIDPSTYAGNLNLCGAPLDKNCTSDEPTSNNQIDDEEDDDNDSPPIWFCIGLMPGFVVGFWIVWGILIFKIEWRHRYFKYLDYMYDVIYVKTMITVPKIKMCFFVMRST